MLRHDLPHIVDGRKVKPHDIFAVKAISKQKLLYSSRRDESKEIIEQDISSALVRISSNYAKFRFSIVVLIRWCMFLFFV